MTVDEILNLPIANWSNENAVLFLWVLNSKLKETGLPVFCTGMECLKSWGFNFHTMIVWNKNTGICPFDHWRYIHEYVIVAYKGKWQRPNVKLMGKLNSVFTEVPKRNCHSRKPEIFYKNIEKHFSAPRLDVFARENRSGFDSWGNEC